MADLEQLEDLIAGTVTIPTIPTTLMEINRIVTDPDGSAAEAAEVVAQDPAIASKVLRLANSSIYALKVAVSDIQHAVCILGLKILKNLVVQATILEQFQRGDEDKAPICANWLWDHSLKTAQAARCVVQASPIHFGIDFEEAYTSGLLHDIGKILLLDSRLEEYRKATEISQRDCIPLHEAETQIFGYSHADVGALLADRWNMSNLLCKAIEHHHVPSGEEELWHVSCLLQVANGIAHQVAETHGGYHSGTTLSEEVLEMLRLDTDVFESILAQVKDTTLAQIS